MLVESGATAVTQMPQTQPALALPPRPRRPLSTWQLFRTFPDNAVAACDDELFEKLLVERRFFWGRLFVVSDPDVIHRILVENRSEEHTSEFHSPYVNSYAVFA